MKKKIKIRIDHPNNPVTGSVKMKFKMGYRQYDPSAGRGNPNEWKEQAETRVNVSLPEHQEQFPELTKAQNEKQLKRAYKKLSKAHHPDMEGGSEETFKQLNQLYETLLSKIKKD